MESEPQPITLAELGSEPFSEHELDALRLAYDLRDRVKREREVVRRLRAHLHRSGQADQ